MDDNENPYAASSAEISAAGASAAPNNTILTIIALLVLSALDPLIAWLRREPSETLAPSNLLIAAVQTLLVVRWAYYDSLQFDFTFTKWWGLFIFFVTLLGLPIYFFRTRGAAGWLPTLAAFGILVALTAVSMAVALVLMALGPPG